MRCRRQGRRHCLRRYCPKRALRSREAATRVGPPASAAALAFFVSRFGVGDPLLQLATRLTRSRFPGVIRVGYSTPFVVDRVECRLDSLLHAGTHFTELVGDVTADVFHEFLGVLLYPTRATRNPTTSLFPTLRGEEQRGSGAQCQTEYQQSDPRLTLFDDDVRSVVSVIVFVVEIRLLEVVVLISRSPSHDS